MKGAGLALAIIVGIIVLIFVCGVLIEAVRNIVQADPIYCYEIIKQAEKVVTFARPGCIG